MANAQGKTILVTGGAGFIGSHLCERLVADGHRVISLDNYFTGTVENHVDGVEYRTGHTKDIAEHVPESVDVVYHLGEYSRVAASIKEPALVWDLNMAGTFAVLEWWREKGCKLVYAGSSTKSVGPREDGVSGRDLSPYTWMKAANTELVANYSRWYGLPYATVYFYNVYGPRERPHAAYGTVIETFRQNYLAGTPHQIHAPGTQIRAFTHVDDAVEGIVLAGEQGEGDGYGIAADDCYTLLQVANLFGGDIEMLPATETTRSGVSVDAAKVTALGWQQKRTLKEYISECKKTKD